MAVHAMMDRVPLCLGWHEWVYSNFFVVKAMSNADQFWIQPDGKLGGQSIYV
jgi:hypothetical protein